LLLSGAVFGQSMPSLKKSPDRLNGLLSAGDAAEQAGLPDEARTFYKAAAEQTGFGKDSQRPELAHAVEIVRKTSGAQPTVARTALR
jgi:hypothetical protein